MKQKAVISIGNPLKSDDNIANLVLEKLVQKYKDKKDKHKDKKDTIFMSGGTNPENTIGKLQKINPKEIIFVDALFFNGKVGEVRLFALEELQVFPSSTHNIPVSIFKNFFPKAKISVIGIRPKKIEPCTRLSKELEQKLVQITAEVSNLL
jgi:hydrogenase maturation protease